MAGCWLSAGGAEPLSDFWQVAGATVGTAGVGRAIPSSLSDFGLIRNNIT